MPFLRKKAIQMEPVEANLEQEILPEQKDISLVIGNLLRKEVANASSRFSDSPVIKIVDLIFAYAYRDKVSDIHIESEEDKVLIRFRIDGMLHDILRLERSFHSSIITRIKVLANLRTDEHLMPQDGRLRVTVDNDDLDIRVSIVPTSVEEKIVLRLLSSKHRVFSLSELGMAAEDEKKVQNALRKSHGMILSTGPTGSGKTTSIYALLQTLSTREKNVTTIEDPVEYRIKGVTHIPVNNNAGFTFAHGLRSVLRQDPDIIFVGEVRDSETANLVVNSALTGHMVLSTVHTNDAAGALPRLIDMKVEPFLIASTVNIIIAQRLVRKICSACKAAKIIKRESLSADISDKTLSPHFGKQNEFKVYKGKGCDACRQTGYMGRIGLFEVLEVTDTVRSMILDRKDSAAIRKAAMNEGMTSLLDDGLRKVVKGETTIEEVLRVMNV
jgi:general secretion pathway protein E